MAYWVNRKPIKSVPMNKLTNYVHDIPQGFRNMQEYF